MNKIIYRDKTLCGTLMDMTSSPTPYGFPIHACIDGFVNPFAFEM